MITPRLPTKDNAMKIHTVGIDADDTLWHNETFYREAEAAFFDILKNIATPAELSQHFIEMENRNMPALGYGAKAMTISMIETAIKIHPGVSPRDIQKIIDIGKNLLSRPVRLLPGVQKTLAWLKTRYKVRIITKGEINEQTRKFKLSGLDPSIPYEILPDKTPAAYSRLFDQRQIPPPQFLMIGNSPMSDILPPLSLGCYAAYIPFETTWIHEIAEIPTHPKCFEIQRIDEIIPILKSLDPVPNPR